MPPAPAPKPKPKPEAAVAPEQAPTETPHPASTRAPAADAAELKKIVKEAVAEYEAEQRAAKEAATIHRHDGFYFRVGFNGGYAFDTAKLDGAETTSRGAGGFLEYAVGVNFSESLVLGVGVHTFGVFSPTTVVDGTELDRDHTAYFDVIGVMFDFYPDPRGGWHFGGTLGAGSADIQPLDDENTDAGFGLALGGGHDFWVGEQWSLGLAARFFYIAGASDDFGTHRAFVPMLSFTALAH